MAKNEPAAVVRPTDAKLLQLVIEEVDEARETYELAVQLTKAMPLRSFEDVVRAVAPEQGLRFRGQLQDVRQFANLVPAVVFPIESLENLVTLLAYAVRNAPKGSGQTDPTDAGDARRQFRRLGMLGLPVGRLGPSPAVMGSSGAGQLRETKQGQQPCAGKGGE